MNWRILWAVSSAPRSHAQLCFDPIDALTRDAERLGYAVTDVETDVMQEHLRFMRKYF